MTRPGRFFLRLVPILLLCAGTQGAQQQAQDARPEAHGLQTRSRLVYNPASLNDVQFALLAKTLAADTPVAQWPTLFVRKGDDLEHIVDRAYDFFVKRSGPYRNAAAPETARALVEIIRTANSLSSEVIEQDQMLAIPPVPARPRGPGNAIRHEVAYLDTTSGRSPTVHLWAADAPDMWDGKWDVKHFEKLGARSTAEFVVSLPSHSAELLAAANIGEVAPPERLSLELLGAQPCEHDFTPSHYLEMARARLAADRTRMTTAAATRPLVLIDHNFKDGHGSEVRRVVDQLLADFGVSSLGRFVVNFDLDPRNAPPIQTLQDHPLVKAMLDYSAYLEPLNVSSSADRANGLDWVVRPDALANGNVVPIAPFVLQSSINVQLRANAWLSLSWRSKTGAPAMPAGLDGLLKQHAAFVAVAAGNDKGDIVPDRDPQRKAAGAREFVNVTHGSADGQVCGSRTGTDGEKVHLLARGVSTDSSGKPVYGSSYAAPVVAVAAWLRHLSDGTTAERMREALFAGSSFLPSHDDRSIEAKGIFDPARFLARAGLHLIDSAGGIVPLSGMTLSLGKCGTFTTAADATSLTRDLVVFRKQNRFMSALRRTTPNFPNLLPIEICEPDAISFRATRTSGETLTFMTLEDFVASVRQVHF